MGHVGCRGHLRGGTKRPVHRSERGDRTGPRRDAHECHTATRFGRSATKRDLEASAAALRAEIADLRAELKTEIADLRSEMLGESAALRTSMTDCMLAVLVTIVAAMVGISFMP